MASYETQNKENPFDTTRLGVFVNTVKGLPRAALDVGKEIFQGTARNVASVGKTVQNVFSIGREEITPSQDPRAQRLYGALFGRETPRVEDIPGRIATAELQIKESPFAKRFGLDKFAFPLAFGGVIGAASLDFIPFGGEAKFVKTLARETNPIKVATLLKKARVAPDIADRFAPLVAQISDEVEMDEVLRTLKGLVGLDEATKRVVGGSVDEVFEEAGEANIKNRIEKAENSLREIYRKSGKSETLPEFSKADEALANITTKMELSTPGERIFVPAEIGGGSEVRGVSSTFPSWVPEDLRRSDLFEKVFGFLDNVDNLRYPPGAGTKQRALVDAVLKQLDEEVGVDTSALRSDIMESYERLAKERLAGKGTRSPAGSKGGVRERISLGEREVESLINEAPGPVRNNLIDFLNGEYIGAKRFRETQSWLASKELKLSGEGIISQAREETENGIRAFREFEEQLEQTEKAIRAQELPQQGTRDIPSIGEVLESRDPNQFVEGVPFDESLTRGIESVKPPTVRGGITPPELRFRNWKDKAAFKLSRETMQRNIDAVAGEDAPAVHEFLDRPIRENETSRVEYMNSLRQEIREKIVKGLGIRAGSKEDELVQKLGEGSLLPEELTKESGRDWPKIEEASRFFRKKYDELLEMVNAERERFEYKPIPKRDDYFRHFQEISNAIEQFGLILREQDLPTEIAGLTGIFNPGKPFSTAELRRKGFKTTYSALKGMDNYIDSISRQIFHIDSVQRGRALEKYIRQSAKVGGEINDELRLPNFVANLHDYTNLISGKKSALDRAFESLLGRPVYGLMNWLRSRVASNMIGGNISSALTNFIPFTQSLATTKKTSAIHGLGETLMSPFRGYNLIDGLKSGFLTRRFPEKGIDIRGAKRVNQMANWLFENVDKFTAKSIVSGKYFDNLTRGMEPTEAMRRADDYAAKVLADRSLGGLPNLMSARSLGFLTQFQTEVNNAYSFLTKDIPNLSEGSKLKLANMVGQLLLFSYLFNSGYEKVTGRRPSLDPIYATLTLLGISEEGEDRTLPGRALEALKDVGENLPFVGGITGGRLPISSIFPKIDSTPTAKELFEGPIYGLLPPVAGNQLRKTIQGISAYSKGKDTTPTGRTRFEIDKTTENLLRSIIFGKSSIPSAQEYYDTFKAGNIKKPKEKSGNPFN